MSQTSSEVKCCVFIGECKYKDKWRNVVSCNLPKECHYRVVVDFTKQYNYK